MSFSEGKAVTIVAGTEKRGKNLLHAVLCGAGKRSCPDFSWIYGMRGEIRGNFLLFFKKRISCILHGALRAWT